jgi:hypothetical protein
MDSLFELRRVGRPESSLNCRWKCNHFPVVLGSFTFPAKKKRAVKRLIRSPSVDYINHLMSSFSSAVGNRCLFTCTLARTHALTHVDKYAFGRSLLKTFLQRRRMDTNVLYGRERVQHQRRPDVGKLHRRHVQLLRPSSGGPSQECSRCHGNGRSH